MTVLIAYLVAVALIITAAVIAAERLSREDPGGHCTRPRKGTRRARARDGLTRLWERLATAETPAPAPLRPVNGRYLGTMARLTTPDSPPWDIRTTQQPVYNQAPQTVVIEAQQQDQGLIA